MKFERESWRKLYVAESAEHRLLSLYTRGLRDYLLRLASDDGTILASTKDPSTDLARALGCEKKEHKAIASSVGDLLRIGYLKHEGGRLWIAKFEEAQQSRSPEARRQAAWREAHGKGPKEPSNKIDFGSIRRLRLLDGELCSYCGTQLDFRLGRNTNTATLDHVYPRQLGGGDEEDNLVLACWSCNSSKGPRPPEQAGLTLRNARVSALRQGVMRNAGNNVGIDETRRDETTTPKPPAGAEAAVSGGKIPCPGDLTLTPEQRGTLEAGGNMVPGWAIDVSTQRFVSKAVADQGDRRTLVHWRKCLAIAVSGDWNGSNRPTKPVGDGGPTMQLPPGVKFGAEGMQ